MPYDRAADVVRLAIRMQGSGRGLTLDDVQREFEVSRRTAERLRDAVEDVFGPLETVDTGEARRHCRLRTRTLRHLVSLSAEELAELAAAADALDRSGLEERGGDAPPPRRQAPRPAGSRGAGAASSRACRR